MAERSGSRASHASASRALDWTCRPTSAFLGWGLPIALGLSSNGLPDSLKAGGIAVLVWAIAYAWMGTACLVNAGRCHRLHCYMSGPVLLLAALVTGLGGLGIVPLGPNGLNIVAGSALGLVLLSHIPELVFGRYKKPDGESTKIPQ